MKIMILDGNSLLNRAFYGIRNLTNKKGIPTNAIYGFISTYINLFSRINPDGVCVCFDLKAPTFRHKEFDGYKAGRRPMPEELVSQIPLVKKVLDLMGIPRFELEGYEADDLIGTFSSIIGNSGNQSVIVTGDRDSFQLIDKNTIVHFVSTKNGESSGVDYTEEVFAENYCGLMPKSIIDLKGLAGDSSDNIPGVDGIGDKTASSLVCRFRSLDGIYENISSPDIKETVRKKLVNGEQSARLSYRLATIKRDVPIDFNPDMSVLKKRDESELYNLFVELELKTLMTKLSITGAKEKTAEPTDFFSTPSTVISDYSKISYVLDAAKSAEQVALYSNTEFSSVSLCLGEVVYLLNQSDFNNDEWHNFLSNLFDGSIKLIIHNAKPLLRALMNRNINVSDIEFDTAVASYLLASSIGQSLDEAIAYFFECPLNDPSDDKSRDINLCNCRNAAAVMALYKKILPMLKQDNLLELMRDIELPLVKVLAEMEVCGICIDKDKLSTFGEQLNSRITIITEKIYASSGHEFNINSTKALGEVLFDELGLPTIKKTKTGYSTNIDVLNQLKKYHEIIPLIIEYRELVKLKSTYIDGLAKVISPTDGKIHTTYEQFVTVTGRLSSTEPNLQNIPIRKASGAEIRKMFIASDGRVLVDADYSQIELRVLAHISNDTNMIQAFKEGLDIHSATASQVFHTPLDQVTPKMRSAAKAVNFGIVYGISDFSLSEDISVSRSEAKQYIESYLSHYNGIREYMTTIKERAKTDGYVTTMLGRRRYIPELKSSNFNLRSFGERVALNTPVQGTAADIIKIAMIRVRNRLQAEKLKSKLILQIHDELIIDAPIDEAEYVSKLLKEEMESAFTLNLPLIADVSKGESWYDAK